MSCEDCFWHRPVEQMTKASEVIKHCPTCHVREPTGPYDTSVTFWQHWSEEVGPGFGSRLNSDIEDCPIVTESCLFLQAWKAIMNQLQVVPTLVRTFPRQNSSLSLSFQQTLHRFITGTLESHWIGLGLQASWLLLFSGSAFRWMYVSSEWFTGR